MKNKILFTAALTTCYALSVSAQQSKKPNVLFFIADDLARNELGCYGGENVKTPHIDRFAKEGVRFNRMFSSTTMCAPTRASIYTGLYPVHNGVYKNHGDTKPEVKSIVHYFQEMGYRVGLTGKTHFRPRSVYNFEMIEGFEPNCVKRTADYTFNGISGFMKRDDKQPFCLVVCSTLPHAPWTVGDPAQFEPEKLKLPPHFVDNAETREALCKYLAEVAALDQQFGDVLETLEKTGKEKETLVIFSGEQGPQFPGGKWTSWDYGQKSAFIIKSPEGYLNGKTTEAVVQYEDVLPTLIDYAGGKIPKEMEGESFLPVLKGKKSGHRKWAYGVHNNVPEGTPYPIRSIRNDSYKLIVNLTPEASYFEKHLMNPNKEGYWDTWVRDAKSNDVAKKWVDRYVTRPEIELYDTEKDPWELTNLASDQKMKPIIDRMKKELFNWMKQQGDTGKALDVETGE
ncbi:sulfatase family protein [Gaoshiqia sediminis]|uniref:Sulfatase n=1 Tax=Gaoshiqia sediminis TaxID=2986998 RepID=A0AA42CAT3_9BACT|nr:sulfatase [Gaoshiqia sediminis]MCW0484247.1 sulfatase [Gaoshiqia sediminis]